MQKRSGRSIPLIVSLVMPRLDYGNATLAGLPDKQLSRLQSVLNAAARLVFSARKHEAVSPLLRDLHWLIVPQRIDQLKRRFVKILFMKTVNMFEGV